jgi:hypothetical protein
MRKEATMVQTRYSAEQLKQLDEARFSQKTDAINRRVNAVYFHGLGFKRSEDPRTGDKVTPGAVTPRMTRWQGDPPDDEVTPEG